jgi:hypothetical protein
VIHAALELLAESSGPVLRDFPDEAADIEPGAPIQASAVESAGAGADVAMETTQMRRYHEQWVERSGRTSVGLTGIPPARFRGVVRFLEAFAAGGEGDMRERPSDVPPALFIRRCIDDLKAMYYEARMVTKPEATGEEVARWFWSDTALAQLIRRVKERMEAAEDPALKGAAFGIAR